MGNRDINLFKAAGGERAKSTKRSPVLYMMLLAIILIVAAIGVMVVFNVRADKAESDYEEKENILANYQNTKMNVLAKPKDGESSLSLAEEYLKVRDDIEAAAVINSYIDSTSALYPKASTGEIEAVKQIIESQSIFTINEVQKDEEGNYLEFTPTDYDALRESLYENRQTIDEDRELFYYALQNLSNEQKENPGEGRWFTYFRGYMLLVFTGDSDESVLTLLCERLISNTTYSAENSSVVSPFSCFEMVNNKFSGGIYSPARIKTKTVQVAENELVTYNLLLIPMKSVIERVVDILEACAESYFKNDELAQAVYALDQIHFTNQELQFDLYIYKDTFDRFMTALDNPLYFKVDDDVVRSKGEPLGDYEKHSVTLHYTYVQAEDNND